MRNGILVGTAVALVLAVGVSASFADMRSGFDGERDGFGMQRGDGVMQREGRMPQQGDGWRGEGRFATFRGQERGMAFELFDADGDGTVTRDEILARQNARFTALDADGDGQVTRQEYVDHAMAQIGERAGQRFDRLDVDGDGRLSQDALAAAQRGGPDPDRLLARFDSDADGVITQAEFEEVREIGRDMRGHGRFPGWGGRANN